MKFAQLRAPDRIFWGAVIIPTLLAILYFGVFANDVYISESRFVVRSPERGSGSALGAMLGVGGIGDGAEKSHAVVEYVRSRDALTDINQDGLVSTAFGANRATVFDRFGQPFGGDSFEHLYRYFGRKVAIDFDATSQVTRLTVRAFSPQEAAAINQRLLDQAERLVNVMSERARSDMIKVARGQVAEARTQVQDAANALASFRARKRILDPVKEAEVRLQMISKLQDQLISAKAQLEQLERYTPGNTQIPAVRTRVRSLEREIDAQTTQIAGAANSLSAEAVEYQALRINSDVADKQLAVALTALQSAIEDARRKQAYVERIASPNKPDYPLEPRRWRGILATFILGLLAWGVLRTLTAGLKEHHD